MVLREKEVDDPVDAWRVLYIAKQHSLIHFASFCQFPKTNFHVNLSAEGPDGCSNLARAWEL